MSRSKLKVRQIREILRYRFDHKVSYNTIATSLGISKGSVCNTIKRFKESDLEWPLSEISDSDLETHLYPSDESASKGYNLPSFEYIRKELSRPHVTLQLLFEEYRKSNPKGLGRSAFYKYFQTQAAPKVTMKMIHKAGDKLFVDYSGDSVSWVDRFTGEVHKTELFVASWGASSFCYAEVTESQKSGDFTMSHVRSFDYFGCVPHAIVPDNLKSAVIKADRYNPTINELYGKMAEHYDTVILPARVRKPQDKAAVESNVLHIQRFILGRLRNHTFFSLAEINQEVHNLLREFNARPMKEYGNQTRRQRFEELDFVHAKQLPQTPFEISRTATVTVAPNYHIRFENHNYSVPNQLVRKKVDVYLKGEIVEIYYDGKPVCRHRKGPKNYLYTTVKEHMPKTHQFQRGWSPEWLVSQAERISPDVKECAETLLRNRRHPEQAFNSVMGILRLAKVYGVERLSAACRRAAFFHSVSFKSIRSILERKLDQRPWENEKNENSTSSPAQRNHENIRGAQYYNKEEECILKQS